MTFFRNIPRYIENTLTNTSDFERNNGAEHDNFENLFDKIKTSDTKK